MNSSRELSRFPKPDVDARACGVKLSQEEGDLDDALQCHWNPMVGSAM